VLPSPSRGGVGGGGIAHNRRSAQTRRCQTVTAISPSYLPSLTPPLAPPHQGEGNRSAQVGARPLLIVPRRSPRAAQHTPHEPCCALGAARARPSPRGTRPAPAPAASSARSAPAHFHLPLPFGKAPPGAVFPECHVTSGSRGSARSPALDARQRTRRFCRHRPRSRIFGLSVPLKLTGHRGLAPPDGTRSPGSARCVPRRRPAAHPPVKDASRTRPLVGWDAPLCARRGQRG
jgi:hypothetical protein